jgi:hypothetical protein
MGLMPPTLRPWVEVPILDREQLKGVQAELIGALGELAGAAAPPQLDG